MTFATAAIIGGAASLGAAGIGAWASMAASGQQTAALGAALQQQRSFFDTARGALQPYINTGTAAGTTLQKFTQPGPDLTSTLSQLPGFQFATDWGTRAVQNLGTTTGLGGNTLTAGAEFATGLASQNWLQYLGPLLQLYGTGAQAAGSLAGTAGTFGQQATGALTGIGQAQAAGTLGAANAIGGGLQGGGNAAMNYALLSRLFPGGAAASPNSPQATGMYPQNILPYNPTPTAGYINPATGLPA